MTQSLSPSQLRAARALLNWSRANLAQLSGVSELTIHRIENEINRPNPRTQNKLHGVLEQAGIEFLESDGVRIRTNQVRVFSGYAGYKQLLDQIYFTLKNFGGKIRQFNLSDKDTLPHAGEYARVYINEMKKIRNLDARVLTIEGDYYFPAPYCTYRWLKKENRVLIPYYIYNDYLTMPIFRSNQKVEFISIHSKLLAERFMEQFDLFWDSALIPDKKASIK